MSSYNTSKGANSDDLKSNIFVTQINERESENVIKSFIVKDTPETLIKNGFNTLQETLVLKKEKELNNVDVELFNKRQEYEKMMSQLMKKRHHLTTSQQSFIDQMKAFDSFIEENDSKRRRALLKYQSEVRLLEYQNKIKHDLEKEIADIKILHEKLLKKVQRNKKYEDFLIRSVDYLPQDYIKVSDNVLGGLIMRYNTLFSTNEALISDMATKAEEGSVCATELSKMKQSHGNKILLSNYKLSKMYEEHEKLKHHLESAEQDFKLKHGDLRNEVLNFGLTLRAIDNITKKCARKFDPTIIEDDFECKIEKIQDYIKTSKQIIEVVQHMKDEKPTQLPQIPNKVALTVYAERPNKSIGKARLTSSRSK